MKTMKNLILILTFIFGLTLTSCSKYDDFLSEQNDQITQIENESNKKYINTDTVTIMNEEINKYQIRAEIKIKAKVFDPSTYTWNPNNNSTDYYPTYHTRKINIYYERDTLLTNKELENIKTNKSISIRNDGFIMILDESKLDSGCWLEEFMAQLYNESNCYLPEEYEKYRDKWQFFYYDEDGILKTTDNIKSFEFTNIEIKKIK